jgi:hypothetical protein
VSENAPYLGDREARFFDVLDHLAADYAVEEGVWIRQRLGGGNRQLDAVAQSLPRLFDHELREVHAVPPIAEQLLEDVTGAAADVEDTVTRVEGKEPVNGAHASIYDQSDQWVRVPVIQVRVESLDHFLVPAGVLVVSLGRLF